MDQQLANTTQTPEQLPARATELLEQAAATDIAGCRTGAVELAVREFRR